MNPVTGPAARGAGRLDQTIRRLRAKLRRTPLDPLLHLRLGEVLLLADQVSRAAEHLRRAVELAPADSRCLMAQAQFLDRHRLHEKAADLYRSVLELDAGDIDARWRLGRAQRRAGQLESAIGTQREALARSPGNVYALAELALAYWSRGDAATAREMFAAVHEASPDDVFARCALASLDSEAALRAVGALRVALHMSRDFHFPILFPIFERLREAGHPVRLAGDPDLLRIFRPTVIVTADLQGRRLAALAPGATTVYVRHGLTSKNHLPDAGASCDFLAGITSGHVAGTLVREYGLSRDRIWVTGHVPMDPLFAGTLPPPPLALRPGRPTILFAPTWNRRLSAADLTGARTVDLLRDAVPDANVIIKPHPHTMRMRPDWLAALRRSAHAAPGVVLVDDPAADVMPLLPAADVLVSDVSSVVFSWLALDRPVVLVTHPRREQDPGFDPGGIEWRWRDMGEEVTEIGALPAAVARALADPRRHAAQRARYREWLFGEFTDGRAAQRIADRIGQLAG